MTPETDPNTFTQKDLMQHLLHAAQHSVTREEMAGQFSLAEKINQERFEMLNKQFDQAEKTNQERFEQVEKINQERFEMLNKQFEQAEKINQDHFDQSEKTNQERFNRSEKQFEHVYKEFDTIKLKHDRLLWALFTGMLAIFFKDVIINLLA